MFDKENSNALVTIYALTSAADFDMII